MGLPAVTSATPLRVAMAVYGDITYDSRVQREATALADAGHTVTLFCLAWSSVQRPTFDERVDIRPVMPDRTAVVPGSASPFHDRRPMSALRRLRTRFSWLVGYARNLRTWGRMVERGATEPHVWHLHDFPALLAIAPRLDARVPLVYDVHDIFTETGTGRRLPGPLRRTARAVEKRLVRRAALVVAVNEGVADHIGRRARPRTSIVVHNAAPRWEPPEPRPDLIRERLGLAPGTPVVLYHGLLSHARGLERLCDVMLEPELTGAHLALMGYGLIRDKLVQVAADPRYGRRIHILDPVEPDALLPWVASADVGAITLPPVTRNLYLATPNKLFECIAAGTPPVVSDFPLMRRIVMDDPLGSLGTTCDPDDTGSIARALAGIISLDHAARSQLRQRCLAAARSHWNWQSEVAGLVAGYEDLGRGVHRPALASVRQH
jgi:glycosyltransferase involved in cell wall biosynthesis